MISTWSEWKRFPHPQRGEQLEAPVGPGIFEVRRITGELFAFGATESVARSLANLSAGPTGISALFSRRDRRPLPELEYRTSATRTLDEARGAASSMIGRRGSYMRGAA